VGVGDADEAVAWADEELCGPVVDVDGAVPQPATAIAEEAPTKPTT
jgi:hypothetical protein